MKKTQIDAGVILLNGRLTAGLLNSRCEDASWWSPSQAHRPLHLQDNKDDDDDEFEDDEFEDDDEDFGEDLDDEFDDEDDDEDDDDDDDY